MPAPHGSTTYRHAHGLQGLLCSIQAWVHGLRAEHNPAYAYADSKRCSAAVLTVQKGELYTEVWPLPRQSAPRLGRLRQQ